MRFAITQNGYFCMVPQAAEVKDTIVVLQGGSVPFVLRETDRDEKIEEKEGVERVKGEEIKNEEIEEKEREERVEGEKIKDEEIEEKEGEERVEGEEVEDEEIEEKEGEERVEGEEIEEEEIEDEEATIWTMKGTCYVHDMMDGAVFREMKSGKRECEYFVVK